MAVIWNNALEAGYTFIGANGNVRYRPQETNMKPDVQFEILIDGDTVLTEDGPEIEAGRVSLRVRFNHGDDTWITHLAMTKEEEAAV